MTVVNPPHEALANRQSGLRGAVGAVKRSLQWRARPQGSGDNREADRPGPRYWGCAAVVLTMGIGVGAVLCGSRSR